MSYSLSELESRLEEDVFNEGLEWVDSGNGGSLMELEKNLFGLASSDGFEPEALLSGTKVVKTACDCGKGRAGDFCFHQAALLITVRRKLNADKSRNKLRKKVTNRPVSKKKINTANILELAEDKEIKNFVREYARRNRQFSLALRTRFVHLFESEDAGDKYSTVLDAVIKANSGRTHAIKSTANKRLCRSLDDLLYQAENSIADNQFAEAFALLSRFVPSVVPLIWRTSNDELRKRISTALELMNRIVRSPNPSPELKDGMAEWYKEEIVKFKYRGSHLVADFIPGIFTLFKEEGKLNELLALCLDRLENGGLGVNVRPDWLLLRFKLALENGEKEVVDSMIRNSGENRFLLSKITEEVIASGNLETASLLLEILKQSSKEEHLILVAKTESALLKNAIRSKDKKRIRSLTKDIFLRNKEMKFFELLKEYSAPSAWEKTVKSILKELKESRQTWASRSAIAEVLNAEKKYSDLLDYAKELNSAEVIFRYVSALSSFDRKRTFDLYEDLFKDHISRHLGPQGAEFAGRHLMLWDAMGERKRCREMVAYLKEEYPNRGTLMGVL